MRWHGNILQSIEERVCPAEARDPPARQETMTAIQKEEIADA